jgi:hypothetical protein
MCAVCGFFACRYMRDGAAPTGGVCPSAHPAAIDAFAVVTTVAAVQSCCGVLDIIFVADCTKSN